MITLTAKINLLSGDNTALSLGSNNLLGNNISSDLGDIVGTKKQGSNPFQLGMSRLGDGSTFSGKVDFFVPTYSDYTTFTINDESKALTSLTIEFGKRHPTAINVDGTTYKDDNRIFTIGGLTPSNTHTIDINGFYPILGLYTKVSIEIDRRNLISISRSIFDRADLKLPSWGIISNTGSIEFNDIDGAIRNYAEQLLLEKGLKCEIKLNNTLVDGASEQVGLFETDEWNYDNDNRVVSVTIKDDLEEWQDINVDEISYDPRTPASKTFKWLYDHLWSITSTNYNMLSYDELNTATKNVIIGTTIKYPLVESGSLWQQWTKFCEALQLHIYKDNDGVIVCRYNGGN